MPPKRKRVDGEPEATSSSARSARSSAKKTTIEIDDIPAKPPPKKARAKPKATKASAKVAALDDDEPVNEDESGPSIVTTSAKDASKPYTPALAVALFNTYADPDSILAGGPAIGPDGFEKLCNDAQIPLEGPLPLVLAWMLDAKEMGKIWKDEWVKATSTLQISSLYSLALAVRDIEALLLLDKAPLKRPPNPPPSSKKSTGKIKEKEREPYNRDRYWEYAADKKATFLKLYGFCFTLAKPPQARNIDMETATAFWSVLLVPQYPIMKDVIDFINEKGTYKGANKDLWNMMLEFCQIVKPSLEDYEADGAWPTLLDDFVTWKKIK